MVRFSDIIGTGLKEREKAPSKKPTPPGKLWLSESQILKPKEKEPEEESQGFPSDRSGEKAKVYYKELLERIADIRQRVKENRGIVHSPILSSLHHIIEDDFIDPLFDYALSIPEKHDLFTHTICVTLGSLKVGKGLKYDTKKLLKLGLAAFLENVGMYKIPDYILKKEGILDPDEIGEIRRHPEVSAQILRQMGSAFDWLAEVASQVHERSDGSGYPKGLKKEEISELASIIGLMDTYMAMIRNRPYRNRFIQSEAVKSIIEVGKGKFPPRVVKEFLNQISLFPVNTHVRLNNRSIGRVLKTEKSQPLRPTIELLYDGQGQKMEKPKIIRLSESPLLHIVDTIDERELP